MDKSWHLPCDDEHLTYRQFIQLAAEVFGTEEQYKILKKWQLKLAGMFNKTARGAAELLPHF
ncbi:hypothetical protein PVT68_00580 [Microbulbifer bruguierae]|uniref:Uncharacterized protein n=1 Tax=Microbulbifer bruguierae TaxID=3029061 RepID=A0ABY8NDL6_9GAMM|nr:hypothetical protein [Microbulbifer bruguierae]WGL16810.1 hypothetical protein PVT68_00580 [Microbulbifer bruguierae]